MPIDPISNVPADTFDLYSTFMGELEGREFETTAALSQSTPPQVPEGKQFYSAPKSTVPGMVNDRNLEKLLAQTETPEKTLQRSVKAVVNNSAWGVFQEKMRSLAELWERKLVDRSLKILTGSSGVVADYLAYLFIARKAAFSSAGQTAVPGSTAPPNLKTLRYAGAAGLCSNSLTLIEAIPQTVMAIVQIVGAIKDGVDLRKKIIQTEQKLLDATNRLALDTLSPEEKFTTATEKLELEKTLSNDQDALSKLPLQGVIAATFGVFSLMSTAQGAAGIAMIALFSTTHGQITATIATLAQAASIMGIIGASVGVVFGGVALALNINTAKNTIENIKKLEEKVSTLEGKLEDLQGVKKTLAEYELKRLKNELLGERDIQSNNAITTASNTVLTFAGIMGLLAVTGVATGPGAAVLGGIGVILVVISASISVGHYFYRKKTDALLAQAKTENFVEEADLKKLVESVDIAEFSDEELEVFLPAWANENDKLLNIENMRAHPIPYLIEHFNGLLKPKENASEE